MSLLPALFIILCTAVSYLESSLPAALAQIDEGRYVRVTTGATQFRNWEQPLIQGNPNLAHFTWMPVTGYVQGRQKVVQRRGPDLKAARNTGGQRSVYIKPICLPPGYAGKSQASPEVKGAIHIPTVIARRNAAPQAQATIHGALRVPREAQEDLLGKLARQRADEAIAARMRHEAIATYPTVSGNLLPRVANEAYGQGVSQSVHGLLRAAFRDK